MCLPMFPLPRRLGSLKPERGAMSQSTQQDTIILYCIIFWIWQWVSSPPSWKIVLEVCTISITSQFLCHWNDILNSRRKLMRVNWFVWIWSFIAKQLSELMACLLRQADNIKQSSLHRSPSQIAKLRPQRQHLFKRTIHLVDPVLIFRGVAHMGAVHCIPIEMSMVLPHHDALIPGMYYVHVSQLLNNGQT